MARFDSELEVPCPYCGNIKKVYFAQLWMETNELKLAWCGKCDKQFLVAAKLVTECSVYAILEDKTGEQDAD